MASFIPDSDRYSEENNDSMPSSCCWYSSFNWFIMSTVFLILIASSDRITFPAQPDMIEMARRKKTDIRNGSAVAAFTDEDLFPDGISDNMATKTITEIIYKSRIP